MLTSFFSSLPSLSLAIPVAFSHSFTHALCAAAGCASFGAAAAGFFAGAAGAFLGAAGGAGVGAVWAAALPARPATLIATANATAPACRMQPAAAGRKVQCAILLSTFPCEASLADLGPCNELRAPYCAWSAT